MFLIKLNPDNTVASAVSSADMTAVPLLTSLDSSYMFAPMRPEIGQVFDPEAKEFANPPRKRWLTKLAFDSRFTMAEAAKLKVQQMLPPRLPDETDAAYAARANVPAQLQVMQSRLNMATYIDLDRADTQQSVQLLEQLGLIAAGRAAQILGDPIAPYEYFPDA